MALDLGPRQSTYPPPPIPGMTSRYGTTPGTMVAPGDPRLQPLPSGRPLFDLHAQAGVAPGTPVDAYGVPARPVDRRNLGMSRALDYYTAVNGPAFAQNDMTRDSLLRQIGMAEANQQTRTGYLNQDFSRGNQRIDVQRDALGIDRAGNQRNLGYLDQLQGFAARLLGLQTNDVGISRRQAWAETDQAQRQAKSSATARGAYSAPGLGISLNDIAGQLTRTGQRLDVQQGQNQLGFDRESASIANQRAQTKDQAATLDIRARELGLDRADLQTSLDRGIEQLNLDTYINTNDLMDAMASNDINRRMTAEQIFRQALDSADVFGKLPAGKVPRAAPRISTGSRATAPASSRLAGSRNAPR